MKLPFEEPPDEEPGLVGVDPEGVDWTSVRRSAYLIHQRSSYRYEGPVRHLHQRLVVHPRHQHGDQRRVLRRLRVVDATPRQVDSSADAFGNDVVDITIPHVAEAVSFISWSVVERDATARRHLVDAMHLRDPRWCTPTELTAPDTALSDLALDIRAAGARGVALAEAACSRVHAEMTYEHGITGVGTTAAEAYSLRKGVCQDLAHVMLAVTRELGLASRYVSGQLIGTGGSHAWVEVLVPDGEGHAEVVSLDPTHDRLTTLTYLTIAVGRDYRDVAPLSGWYRSPHAGRLSVSKTVTVVRVDSDLEPTG
ncbi:MAG: transglutaminase family protein [Candidatus Dormibacteria bacterium]